MSLHSVIVIAGPTASGKSQLAVDLAKLLNGVVINGDSQQIYQATPILAACPSLEDKETVPHLLYEIWSPQKKGSVVDWLTEAEKAIRQVWAQGKLPIVVGGTGLYLDNLINGTTPIPECDPQVRKKVQSQAEKDGIPTLHARLAEVDPQSFERLKPNDSSRVKRAWEVYLQTGITVSEWFKKPMIKHLSEARFVVVKINPSMAELQERCSRRFDLMMQAGAEEEVSAMLAANYDSSLPAMRALGLPELSDYLKGKITREAAVNLAKLHSRQYAKRQRTWFNGKLKADIVLEECYKGQKNIVNDVKNAL